MTDQQLALDGAAAQPSGRVPRALIAPPRAPRQPAPPGVPVWPRIRHAGEDLYDIGVGPDGTLHNPNGYDQDLARAAIAGAEDRLHQRRVKAAQKAAETRRRRLERRYYDTAKRLIAGEVFGPASRCRLCGRGFSDPDSIERGIGPECWIPLNSLCNAIRAKGDEDGFDWLEVVRGLLRRQEAQSA